MHAYMNQCWESDYLFIVVYDKNRKHDKNRSDISVFVK